MSQLQELLQDICQEYLLVGKKFKEVDSTWNGAHDQLNVIVRKEGISVPEFIKKKTDSFRQDDQDAFFVADLSDVVYKYYCFQKELPRVKPFYAVKCNDRKEVLQTLAFLGTGFDCASKAEIDQVLSLGVPPDDIVYANTCKQPSYIRHAANHGVSKMTFDCESELLKVAENHPAAKMILRIVAHDNGSVSHLSNKFGATLEKCEDLLKQAKILNVTVVGVSFHVGSKSRRPQAFYQGIADARYVFDIGRRFGHEMRLLDIGGGFPGDYDFQPGFQEFATVIHEALDQYFPSKDGVEIISEPGRYFVASAFTAAINVIGKKEHYVTDKDGRQKRKFSYYLNDGAFGTFWLTDIQGNNPNLRPLKDYHHSQKHFPSTLWGPCCTDLDIIMEEANLPELEIGDWIIFPSKGAYTLSRTSTFNGFQTPTVYYTLGEEKLKKRKQKVLSLTTQVP